MIVVTNRVRQLLRVSRKPRADAKHGGLGWESSRSKVPIDLYLKSNVLQCREAEGGSEARLLIRTDTDVCLPLSLPLTQNRTEKVGVFNIGTVGSVVFTKIVHRVSAS